MNAAPQEWAWLDALPQAVLIVDGAGFVRHVNPAAETLFDTPGDHDETTPRALCDLFESETDPAAFTEWLPGPEEAKALRRVGLRRCGILRDLRLHITRAPACASGNEHGWLVSVEEIHEHDSMLAWLKSLEQAYSFLIERTQDIYYSIQLLPTERFTFVSPAVKRLTGYNPSDFYANPGLYIELTHPDDRPIIAALFEGHIATENPVALRFLHADGQESWVELRCRIHYDEAGRPAFTEGLVRDINQQMRMEEKLRHAEERFRALFDLAPDGIYLHDLNGRFLDINERATQVLRKKKSEVVGHTIFDLGAVSEAQREPLKQMMQLLMTQNQGGPFEFTYFDQAGRRRVVELSAQVVQEGATRLALTTARDLTARREAEENLNESRELLRLAMQNAGISLWVVDRRGIMKIFGGQGLRKLGWTPQNTVGRSIFALATAYPEISDGVQRAMEGQSSLSLIKIPQLDTVVEVHSSPFLGGDQKTIGVLGVALDVTERVNAEEALWENMHQLETVVAAVQAGILIIDRHSHLIVEVNRTAEAFFKLTRAEIIGRPCTQFVCTKQSAKECPIETGELEAPVQNQECIARDATGRERPILKSVVPITFKGAPHFLESFIDVTEQKEAEEERRRLEKQLLQAQRMESLAKLAGGVAHDFNNLLTAVIGNLSLAMMDLPADSDMLPILHEIDSAAKQAAELSQQMLAYTGQHELVMNLFDMGTLLRDMRPLLDTLVPSRAVFSLNVATTESLPVFGDEQWLRTAILNLVANAAEALIEGRGFIRLSSGCRTFTGADLALGYTPSEVSPGLYTYVEVADSGTGMSAETLPLIFDPFFSTKFTGRGLGLAAVLGILRGHRGGITAQSESGGGSTFRLLLPVPTDNETARGVR